NINEATDVGEFQGHARTMRVPSRGSAMSLLSRFGVTPPNWGPKPRSHVSPFPSHGTEQVLVPFSVRLSASSLVNYRFFCGSIIYFSPPCDEESASRFPRPLRAW